MNKQVIGWLALLPALGLVLFAVYSGLTGEHTVGLSAVDIQQRINSHLPRDIAHSRMRVTAATVTLHDSKVELHVDMVSRAGNLQISAASIGVPEFRQQTGAFYFHPENVSISNVQWRGKSPEEIVASFHSDRLSARTESITAWANRTAQTTVISALEDMPVYVLRDEGQGWIVKSALKSTVIHDDRLWVTFSLQQLTQKILVMIAIGLLCIAVAVMFVACPEMILAGFFW